MRKDKFKTGMKNEWRFYFFLRCLLFKTPLSSASKVKKVFVTSVKKKKIIWGKISPF